MYFDRFKAADARSARPDRSGKESWGAMSEIGEGGAASCINVNRYTGPILRRTPRDWPGIWAVLHLRYPAAKSMMRARRERARIIDFCPDPYWRGDG